MCYLFCYLAHYLGLYIPGNSICIVDSIMPENLVKYVFFFYRSAEESPWCTVFHLLWVPWRDLGSHFAAYSPLQLPSLSTFGFLFHRSWW